MIHLAFVKLSVAVVVAKHFNSQFLNTVEIEKTGSYSYEVEQRESKLFHAKLVSYSRRVHLSAVQAENHANCRLRVYNTG